MLWLKSSACGKIQMRIYQPTSDRCQLVCRSRIGLCTPTTLLLIFLPLYIRWWDPSIDGSVQIYFYSKSVYGWNCSCLNYCGYTANSIPIPAVLPWRLFPFLREYRRYCPHYRGITTIPIPMSLFNGLMPTDGWTSTINLFMHMCMSLCSSMTECGPSGSSSSVDDNVCEESLSDSQLDSSIDSVLSSSPTHITHTDVEVEPLSDTVYIYQFSL